jgi:hypothetical protein
MRGFPAAAYGHMVIYIQQHGKWSSTSNNTADHQRRQSSYAPRTYSPSIPQTRATREMKTSPSINSSGDTPRFKARVDDGWSCHLLTFLFSRLPGPRPAVISRMKDEVHRVYSTFLTRVHRKPRAASPDEVPVLIAAADLPVFKWDRTSSPKGHCNGGLHFHGCC